MSSPYISHTLGEAHRAELLRQAERHRRSRPAAAQRPGSPAGTGVRQALVRLTHALRRRTAPGVAVAAAIAAPGERHVRVEPVDSAC